MTVSYDEIPGRPIRQGQDRLFDAPPSWDDLWWGMPEFSMTDASPERKVTVNFMTDQDAAEFGRLLGIPITAATDSAWFPHQKKLGGEFEYDGPKTDSRYPVCIPSKGRARIQTTGTQLERLGVSHLFFVEETEADEYRAAVGENRVVAMPFSDLGQGSIPARNFIWDWAKAHGHARHWVLDDNIRGFARCNANRRLRVRGGGFFRAMEDFVDRFSNVAVAGPHHLGFVGDRSEGAPFLFNSRVYSCILLDSSLPYRWRGRYNEDTDLSLRVLKDGLCTLLFRALLMDKGSTSIGDDRGSGTGAPAMAGGNTDHVYAAGNYRLDFARSLEQQHPDCVKTIWRWGRWHHLVDYSAFAGNTPRLREGVAPRPASDDYGMKLVRVDRARGTLPARAAA